MELYDMENNPSVRYTLIIGTGVFHTPSHVVRQGDGNYKNQVENLWEALFIHAVYERIHLWRRLRYYIADEEEIC